MNSDRNYADDEAATGGSERGTGEGELQRYSVGEDETPSEAVTYALMDGDDDLPLEQQRPLYEVVDPDALDRLFSSRQAVAAESAGVPCVSFRYEGCSVRISSDGRVEATLTEDR